jgi:Multicopper oxidase
MKRLIQVLLPMLVVCLAPIVASAQVEQGGGSFRVQCPTSTIRHPGGAAPVVTPHPDQAEAPYTGPHQRTASQSPVINPATGKPWVLAYDSTHPLTFLDSGGAIKCQQISGGDGYMTEADGNQTYMFSFGPLSGLNAIENGQPGTQFPSVFNNPYCDPAANGGSGNYNNGQPNPYCGGSIPTDPNGAVGYPPVGNAPAGAPADLSINIDAAAIMNTGIMNGSIPAPLMAFDEDDEFLLTLSNVGMIMRPDLFEQHTVHFHGYPNASSFYDGVPDATWAINIGGSATYYYLAPDAGTYFWHCHITPPEHLQMGMVGWLYVRPRQNRVPAGTSLYWAVAGHAAPGSSGFGTSAGPGQQSDLRTACFPALPASTTTPGPDILCSAPVPAAPGGVVPTATQGTYASSDPLGRPDPQAYVAGDNFKYVYNDGDGSTRYDIDVPLQIHGFDPNFHFVGMTFNPEGFADMKDKYFLLNGRSYPDTIGIPAASIPNSTWTGGVASNANGNPLASNAITTAGSDTQNRPSQPAPSVIVLSASGGPAGACVLPAGVTACGQRAVLRIDDLDVQEYQTLSSVGIPMLLVGFNAKILRDEAGNNLYIKTNSITLGGGESLDVIIDSTGVAPGTYFLYTPQLDHLSNDAENFGGLMSEIVVVP